MHFIDKILISSLCFICFDSANAQNNNLYNVKLKSGLIIKCELVNIIPDSFVTVRQYGEITTIKCSEILYLELSDYKSVPKTDYQNAQRPLINQKPKIVLRSLPQKGWTTGFQIGVSLNFVNIFGASFGNQFRFSTLKGINKRWEMGFSLGIDPYFEYDYVFGSLMGQTRYYFKKDMPKSPIFYAQAGYGFNLSAVNMGKDGGVNASIGFGTSSRTKKQSVFCIMYGLRMQNGHGIINYWSWPSVNKYESYLIVGLEIKMEWRF